MAVVVLAAVLVAGAWGYHAATRPARLRAFARAYLNRIFATRVDVAAVEFDPLGGIEIARVGIADPDTPNDVVHPALELTGVRLHHKPAWLLVGRLVVDRIHITGIRASAVFDERQSGFNLQHLLRAAPTEGQPIRVRPSVTVDDVSISLSQRIGSEVRAVDHLAMRLAAAYSESDNAYRIDWVTGTGPGGSGACTLDPAGLSLVDLGGGTPWLKTRTARMLIKAVQPSADRWLEVVQPSGLLRVKDYRLDFGGSVSNTAALTVQLKGVRLSIPVHPAERRDPSMERFLRFAEVAGQMTVAGPTASVDVTGRLRDSPCRLRATLRGPAGGWRSLEDVGFDIQGRVDALQLPRDDASFADQWRLIHSWRRFAHFYRDFDPAGTVNLDVALHKPAGADKRVQLRRLSLESIRTDATCRFFPYRVYDLTGRVDIAPDGVRLIGLRGRHGQGVVTVDGWLSEPRKQCAARIHVSGTGIALDGDVCDALSAKYSSLWNYARPSGWADIDATMVRDRGNDGQVPPWTTVIQSDLLSAELLLAGFAYPVRDVQGTVLIGGDTIVADQLYGRAGTGLVAISGFARLDDARLDRLRVEVQAADLKLDGALIRALPSAPRREVLSFSPSGRAGVNCVLTYAADAGLDYTIDATLDRVNARWQHIPLPLRDVTGQVTISPGRVQLSDIAADCGDGSLHVDGEILADGGRVAPNLTGWIENFRLTETTRNAIPDGWRSAVDDWTIDGPLRVDGSIRCGLGDSVPRLHLGAALAGTTVSHRRFAVPIRIETGRVVVDAALSASGGQSSRNPSGDTGHDDDTRSSDVVRDVGDTSRDTVAVRLDGVRGRCLGASVVVDGSIRIDGGDKTVDIRGSAQGVALNRALADALPWRWRRVWNNIRPTGSVDVDVDRLAWRPGGGADQPAWSVEGVVHLDHAGLEAGIGFSDASGVVRLSGQSAGDFSAMSLDGDAALDRLVAGGVELRNLRGLVVRDGPTARWRVDRIDATTHGGRLQGRLELARTNRNETRFDTNLSISNMNAGGLMAPSTLASATAKPVAGRVNGHLILCGIAGDRASWRGGGTIAIEDAELYRLPILLSVLEVISLKVPRESAFQRAVAEFSMTGDRVRVNSLLLQGQALAMIGDGTVHWPTRRMNLRLVTVSPNRWARVPLLSEMLEGASRELMQVRVQGTPSEPVATAEPLRGLSGIVQTLMNPKPGRAVPASDIEPTPRR